MSLLPKAEYKRLKAEMDAGKRISKEDWQRVKNAEASLKSKGKGKARASKSVTYKTRAMPISRATKVARQSQSINGDSRSTVASNHEPFEVDDTLSTFTVVKSYPIQPANFRLAWLSKVAPGYRRYRFKKLKISYVPRVPTTTAGSVVIAFDADPDNDQPSDYDQVVAYQHSSNCSVYDSMELEIPLKDMAGYRFVRSGAVQGSLSIYDIGQFIVAYDRFSLPGNTPGQFYFEYEIEFVDPCRIDNVMGPCGSLIALLPNTTLTSDGSEHNLNWSFIDVLDIIDPVQRVSLLNGVEAEQETNGRFLLQPGFYCWQGQLTLNSTAYGSKVFTIKLMEETGGVVSLGDNQITYHPHFETGTDLKEQIPFMFCFIVPTGGTLIVWTEYTATIDGGGGGSLQVSQGISTIKCLSQ